MCETALLSIVTTIKLMVMTFDETEKWFVSFSDKLTHCLSFLLGRGGGGCGWHYHTWLLSSKVVLVWIWSCSLPHPHPHTHFLSPPSPSLPLSTWSITLSLPSTSHPHPHFPSLSSSSPVPLFLPPFLSQLQDHYPRAFCCDETVGPTNAEKHLLTYQRGEIRTNANISHTFSFTIIVLLYHV